MADIETEDGLGWAEDVNQVVRSNIRLWREDRGWSQTDLAQRMQDRGFPFHQATIYKLEDGQRSVRLAEAVALSEVFAFSLHELVRVPVEEDEAVRRAKREWTAAVVETAQVRHRLDQAKSVETQKKDRYRQLRAEVEGQGGGRDDQHQQEG